MDDMEDRARQLFIRTRDAMGWPDPEWDELAEETRQMYRDELRRRDAVQPNERQ